MSHEKYVFMKQSLCILILLCAFVFQGFSKGFLDKFETEQKTHAQATLASEHLQCKPEQQYWMALKLEIDEGWHVYWKNPGDSGYPVSIHWEGSEHIDIGEMVWPTPKKFILPGVINYGYSQQVIFLIPFQIKKSSPDSLNLKAKVSWLACKEACIPESQEVTLHLNTGPEKIHLEQSSLFRQARFHLPRESDEIKYSLILNSNKNLTINLTHSLHHLIQNPEFIPDQQGVIIHQAKQKVEKLSNGHRITVQLDEQFKAKEISGVILYGKKDKQSILVKDIINTTDPRPQTKTSVGQAPLGLLTAILFALIGGLILNIMPCVLPVVSLKVLNFIHQAGEDRRKIVLHGLAFTFGVLFSFWLLVGILLSLKAGGEQLGWGFHLQYPGFQMFLCCFMFVFSLNLFGVFEFGTSLTAVGSGTSKKSGLGASLLNGILATIVATPCTGPFMASALGYALMQPAWVSFLVFSCLGIGMASPYLLLSFFPSFLKYIPKPGPWMLYFKQFMGFLLMGTVIFLLDIFGVMTNMNSLIGMLIILLALSLGCWLWGMAQKGKQKWFAIVLIVLIVGFCWQYAMHVLEKGSMVEDSGSAGHEQWQPFDPEKIEQLVRSGTNVFVDYTAVWCALCRSNKFIALQKEAVIKKFKEKNVVLFEADWTHKDEKILKSLESFGKSGVPLYVLYKGGDYEKPVILPQTLTPGIVIDALNDL